MSCVCDGCKSEIPNPVPQEVNGYMFFDCPNCDLRYSVAKISKNGLMLREKLKKARSKIHRIPPGLKRLAHMDKIEQLQARFQKEVTLLKPLERPDDNVLEKRNDTPRDEH